MSDRIPLLLLPGLLCDARLWAAQVEGLADIAAPVVPDLTRDDSFGAMARRVLDAAPARFALAGLSMGGYVAQEIMRQAPARVTKLALLDTSARGDLPEQSQRRRDLIALSERGEFHGVTSRLMPNLIHPDRLSDSALVKAITDMAASVGRDGFLRQETAILGRGDGRPDLARIAVPTLVLCGREDKLTPLKLAEEMVSLIPNATLHIVEHCGHMTTMERPDAVNAAMRGWLLG